MRKDDLDSSTTKLSDSNTKSESPAIVLSNESPAIAHSNSFDWSFSSAVTDTLIHQALGSANFWSDFSLIRATPDGHCLIHSLCLCMGALLKKCNASDLYSDFLERLRSECLSNMSLYISAIDDCSPKLMILEMIRYIYLKDYNTSFGDIVPYMMSNTLCVNIFIIEERSNCYQVHAAHRLDNLTTFNLFLFKRGDHYDACIPKSFSVPDTFDVDNGSH